MSEPVKPFPIRLRPDLRAAGDQEVTRRKRLVPGYSLTALLNEALAHYLTHLEAQRRASE